jgi:hypothetical protein
LYQALLLLTGIAFGISRSERYFWLLHLRGSDSVKQQPGQIAARLSAAAALLDGAVAALESARAERARAALADIEIAGVLVRDCARRAHPGVAR